MPAKIDLTPLLDPRSIAIIGASENQERIGGWPIKLLLESGFEPIYPVNPKYRRIGDLDCFSSIEDVPGPVDLAIIATPAADILSQLEAAHRKGVRAAIIFAAGFAEISDHAGAEHQAAISEFAERTGMAINGPNSIGVVNWPRGVFATFARTFHPGPQPGGTALVGQSGNISSAIYRMATRTNLGFRYAISAGNEACVNLADYLGYLADDPGVDSALCYLEALRDGPGFMDAAMRFRAGGKLLAIFKTGNSEKGAEAARSHTAAMVGDRAAYDAAFAACGVAVAEDIAHLAELAYLHRFAHRSTGPNVAIISVSGAAGAIFSDAFSARGMTIPTLPEDVQDQLRKIVPAYGNTANPVDLTGNVSNKADSIGQVFETVLLSDSVDVMLLYVGGRILHASMASLAELSRKTDKLIVVVDTTESGLRAEVEALGMAFFEEIAPSVRSLATYSAWKNATVAPLPPPGAADARVLAEFRKITQGEASAQLDEVAAKAVLAAGGVAVARGAVAATKAAAVENAERIGYPVVMKVVSADIPHKTEAGGVRLHVEGATAVETAFDGIMEAVALAAPQAACQGILVEPEFKAVHELLLGVERDPVFGWMMTVAAGGVWTELFNDVSHAFLPVDEQRAALMLQSLRSYPVLRGFRGAPAGDVDAACKAIASLSRIVLTLGDEISGCEINPLMVLPAGKGAVAVDALINLPTAPETA